MGGGGVGVEVGLLRVAVGDGRVSSSLASSVATLSTRVLSSFSSALFHSSAATLPARSPIRFDKLSSVIGDCACSCETPNTSRRTTTAPPPAILCLDCIVVPPQWMRMIGSHHNSRSILVSNEGAQCAHSSDITRRQDYYDCCGAGSLSQSGRMNQTTTVEGNNESEVRLNSFSYCPVLAIYC